MTGRPTKLTAFAGVTSVITGIRLRLFLTARTHVLVGPWVVGPMIESKSSADEAVADVIRLTSNEPSPKALALKLWLHGATMPSYEASSIRRRTTPCSRSPKSYGVATGRLQCIRRLHA